MDIDIHIPSKHDLAVLPARALVILAARCAKRIRPRYGQQYIPTPLFEYIVESYGDEINAVEKIAAGSLDSTDSKSIVGRHDHFKAMVSEWEGHKQILSSEVKSLLGALRAAESIYSMHNQRTSPRRTACASDQPA